MHKNLSIIALVVIIFLAGFLRLYKLDFNPPSLFADEVDIGYQVKSFLSTGKDYQGNFLPLQFHSFSDVRTSLPIYSTALISLLPKISIDTAIRLTPAIFSVLSIILIFFLVNNLFTLFGLINNKSKIFPGIWSSLVLSLLPWHYTYSRAGFELSMLLFFVIAGLFFYTKFLIGNKKSYLIIGLILLSLVPMVYSTAKLSVIFYPLIISLIPGGFEYLKNKINWIILSILFIPLFILLLNGGAGKRFGEITIFTDPTIPTEINAKREIDLGPNATVGSVPGLNSKIVHNKLISLTNFITTNFINPASSGFLFLSGDPNQRHALKNWGMLEKSLMIPLLLGIYFIISGKHNRFLLFLAILWLSATTPAVLTRDGLNHASRNYMMILPLVLLITTGVYNLQNKSKILTILLTGLFLFESFFYFHDYWYHYQYDSQRDWHYGLKQVIQNTKKYINRPLIITRNYEPPLIFYLYYSDFPAAKFQEIYKTNTFLEKVDQKLNIEGEKLTGTNIYFASITDKKLPNPFQIKDAVYVVTYNEYLETGELSHLIDETIKFPTLFPVFYVLNTNKSFR